MSIKTAPGVFDILPDSPNEEWRRSHLWIYVENVIRETARDFGYQEIRTPIFERTELFQRSAGETSDIVSKEMYTFEDRGGRLMSLRPEGTAPVMRAFNEHHLNMAAPEHKLFYIGPMFRYERSQAGRYRQHHQFGAEAIGNRAPEQDVEVIDLLYTVFCRLGLKGLKISLNTIGDAECRNAFREALKGYLQQYLGDLSEDSQRRLELNPLRILDSKDPKDREIVANAPSILNSLNDHSKEHFYQVQKLLDGLNIPYEVNPQLVRGLDYYNRTVFEVVAEELGAQNSVGGGGRYDGLLKSLGGPDLPCMGFGTGLERIIQTMLKQEVSLPEPSRPTLFLIPLGEPAKKKCFLLLHQLRRMGISSQMDFSGRKLNKVMQYANQLGAQFVGVVGDSELETQEIELKEMTSGKTRKAPFSQLGTFLRFEMKGENLLNVWNEINKPFENQLEADFFIEKISSSIQETQKLTNDLEQAMNDLKGML